MILKLTMLQIPAEGPFEGVKIADNFVETQICLCSVEHYLVRNFHSSSWELTFSNQISFSQSFGQNPIGRIHNIVQALIVSAKIFAEKLLSHFDFKNVSLLYPLFLARPPLGSALTYADLGGDLRKRLAIKKQMSGFSSFIYLHATFILPKTENSESFAHLLGDQLTPCGAEMPPLRMTNWFALFNRLEFKIMFNSCFFRWG